MLVMLILHVVTRKHFFNILEILKRPLQKILKIYSNPQPHYSEIVRFPKTRKMNGLRTKYQDNLCIRVSVMRTSKLLWHKLLSLHSKHVFGNFQKFRNNRKSWRHLSTLLQTQQCMFQTSTTQWRVTRNKRVKHNRISFLNSSAKVPSIYNYPLLTVCQNDYVFHKYSIELHYIHERNVVDKRYNYAEEPRNILLFLAILKRMLQNH